MQPISHHQLCLLIRTALNQRNLSVEDAADLADINFTRLALMMGGHREFDEKTLASLGELLAIDYSMIAAGYSLYRFCAERAKLRQSRLINTRKGHGSDELSLLASQVISSYPGQPTQLLIQHLMSAVPGLFEPMASSAIKKAQDSSQRTGDYDAA